MAVRSFTAGKVEMWGVRTESKPCLSSGLWSRACIRRVSTPLLTCLPDQTMTHLQPRTRRSDSSTRASYSTIRASPVVFHSRWLQWLTCRSYWAYESLRRRRRPKLEVSNWNTSLDDTTSERFISWNTFQLKRHPCWMTMDLLARKWEMARGMRAQLRAMP